jgi:phosphohistidine phosphatase SixA
LKWCFIRHAQAQGSHLLNTDKDVVRNLTQKGRRQADELPQKCAVYKTQWDALYSSPYLRCWQTAFGFLETLEMHKIHLKNELSYHATVREFTNWANRECVGKNCLFIGHEPMLSQTVASLLGISADLLSFKKAGIIVLEFHHHHVKMILD